MIASVAVSSVFSVPGVRLAPEMDDLLRTHLHTSDVTSKRWTTHDAAAAAAFSLSLPSDHTAFNGLLSKPVVIGTCLYH